jgi:hypothetical protein
MFFKRHKEASFKTVADTATLNSDFDSFSTDNTTEKEFLFEKCKCCPIETKPY